MVMAVVIIMADLEAMTQWVLMAGVASWAMANKTAVLVHHSRHQGKGNKITQ